MALDDELRNLANNDQTLSAVRDMANVIWHYRKGLTESGAPDEVANFFALQFQQILMDRLLAK